MIDQLFHNEQLSLFGFGLGQARASFQRGYLQLGLLKQKATHGLGGPNSEVSSFCCCFTTYTALVCTFLVLSLVLTLQVGILTDVLHMEK